MIASRNCLKCGEHKPLSEFGVYGPHRKPKPRCRPCCAADMRAWCDKNRAKVRAGHLEYKRANPDRYIDSRLRHFFGLSLAEYRELEARQEGKCACCRQPETGMYRGHGLLKPKKLCVDHCHETGRVRGLLCCNCNTALGLLQEDPERVRMLAEYLEFNEDVSLTLAPSPTASKGEH